MTNTSFPRFERPKKGEFMLTLNKRVDEYFRSNNIDKRGDWRMYIKTAFMLLLYIIPASLVLFFPGDNYLLFIFLYFMMGVGMAGIGLSVMHDANHGSYSKHKWLNTVMSYTLNFLGGHAIAWRVQHNFLHHSFTNIDGMDEDITTIPVLRFNPHAKRIGVHKLQFIYAWFFYALMTFFWVLFKDIIQLSKYHKQDYLKRENTTLGKEVAALAITKVAYLGYSLILPWLLGPFSFGAVLGAWLILHATAGLILAAIFQPAHVVPETTFPMTDENNSIEEEWAVHQVRTTMNFAPKSHVFSWFVGGLNFQVEHHLFPKVCHIHYKQISKIVKKTCEEYGLPYHSQPTFVHALFDHTKLLYRLGVK